MARGSLNRADLSAPDDPNYSCVLYKTYIPIVTVVALALEVAILLVLLVLDAILFLSVRFKHDFKKVEDMPSSITELQLAFIRQENDTENEIQPRHLTRYAYKAKDMLRFQHVRGAPEPSSGLLSPSSLAQPLHRAYEPLSLEVASLYHSPQK